MSVRALLTLFLFAFTAPAGADLGADLREKLTSSRYVYIQSMRKSGELGQAAEIWFFFHDDAVWVGTPRDTWRAKRIRAGRTGARIAVGSPDGPSFRAEGEIVESPEVAKLLYEAYARKYPDGWARWEDKFRKGLEDGSRVLIRYRPAE